MRHEEEQNCTNQSFFTKSFAVITILGLSFLSGVAAVMLYIDSHFDKIGFKLLNSTAFDFTDRLEKEDHLPPSLANFINGKLASPEGQTAMHDSVKKGYEPIHHDVINGGMIGTGVGLGCLSLFALYVCCKKRCAELPDDESSDEPSNAYQSLQRQSLEGPPV